jgi:hypothetical protein
MGLGVAAGLKLTSVEPTQTHESNELGMTVTVKSVEGDTANYEVKVDK